MGSHGRPKSGRVQECGKESQIFSDLPDYDDPNAINQDFEALGEDEVRMRLQFHVFDEDQILRAQDWLADREYLHFGDNIQSIRAYARKTNDSSREANSVAQVAREAALHAEASAREAKEVARKANEITNALSIQLRESVRLTALALITSIIALAISVGGIVFH